MKLFVVEHWLIASLDNIFNERDKKGQSHPGISQWKDQRESVQQRNRNRRYRKTL
jgi:hypothetical protein